MKLKTKDGKMGAKFPILESIAQCAGMLGCSESRLKAAKRQGCAAFVSGGRIDTAILLPFLFAEKKTGGKNVLSNAEEMALLNAAKRRQLEREEKIELKEMVFRDEIEHLVWQGCLAPARAKWLCLARQCAAQCNPANPAQAKKVLDDFAAGAMREIEESAPKEARE